MTPTANEEKRILHLTLIEPFIIELLNRQQVISQRSFTLAGYIGGTRLFFK